MATISGNSSNYANPLGYTEDDYFTDGGVITITVSASGSDEIQDIGIRGGSIRWQDCGSWLNWPNNKWSPGILSTISLTGSTTGVALRGSGDLTPDIIVTANTIGSAKFGPPISPDVVLTSSSTGNATFSGTGTASVAFTVTAGQGIGKLLAGTITGDLAVTVSSTGVATRGSGALSPTITTTSSANGVVRISAEATPNLVITATGSGTMTFLGTASPTLAITSSLGGGLVQKPSQDATTHTVDSETRIYSLLNETRTFEFEFGESRTYKVLTENRTATATSESRTQPTEVY